MITVREGLRPGYAYLIAGVAAISGLLFGFDIAVINGALIFVRDQFQLSEIETEMGSSHESDSNVR